VTKSGKLKTLCVNPKLFGLRTVLIITSRDERLLKSLSADHVFTMAEMNENQSLEVFSLQTIDAYCGKSLVGTYLRGQNKNREVHYGS